MRHTKFFILITSILLILLFIAAKIHSSHPLAATTHTTYQNSLIKSITQTVLAPSHLQNNTIVPTSIITITIPSAVPTPTNSVQISMTPSPPTLIPTNQHKDTYPPSYPSEIPSISLTPTIHLPSANFELQIPTGKTSFSVTLKENDTVCDILQRSRDDGKLSSVTFDDSYLAVYKSKYVVEINGYKNNWIFKVNGTSPLGCSLSQPKDGDHIEWIFQ